MKLTMGILCMTVLMLIQGCSNQSQDERFKEYATLNPKGDFVLMDQEGKSFHLKDLRGQVVFIFFGYLSCPDICPTTMSKLTRVYTLLGDSKSKVLTLFVSVDPQRDTPSRLKEYMSYFHINALGLTGSKAQIDEVVSSYKASYERVETESASGYLFNHSDYIYVLDRNGKVKFLARPEDRPEVIAKIVRQLLK